MRSIASRAASAPPAPAGYVGTALARVASQVDLVLEVAVVAHARTLGGTPPSSRLGRARDHDPRARRSRGAGLDRGARPGRRARRGARRRRRHRGEPRRPAAAAGPLPAAAGRRAVPRAGVLGPDQRGRRRGRPAGRSATRCARCCPAAGTPSGSPSRPGSCCRCPAGVDLVDGGRAARGRPARSGRTSSCSPRLRPRRDVPGARRRQRHRHDGDPARPRRSAPGSLCTAGPAGEARRAAASSARTSAINYRDEDFVERVREATDGPGPTSSSTTWARSTWPATSTRWPPNGRLVVIGMQGGTKAELDLGR